MTGLSDSDVPQLGLVDLNVLIGPLPHGDHLGLDRDRLAEQMGRYGIAVSAVHHSWARYGDVARGNAASHDLAAGDGSLVAAAVLVPLATGELGSATDVDDLLAVSRLLVAYPASHGWCLAGYEARDLLERVADAGRPLLVAADEIDLDDVDAVARRHPELPLVISRVGYRSLRRLTALLDAHPSVYCDVSFFAAHQGMEQFVERSRRCPFVYGSASPVCDPAGSVARLAWSGLDPESRTLVAAGHARRLLDLAPEGRGAEVGA